MKPCKNQRLFSALFKAGSFHASQLITFAGLIENQSRIFDN